MKIYDGSDYSTAQRLAYDTILKSRISTLPISIKKIIRKYPNLHLQKYSVFAKKRELTLEQTIEMLDSEDGCLWRRNTDDYIIFYNDSVGSKGRVRFTLAHELGHYILRHNEKTNKTALNRYSLTSEEYDSFEKEANYFAKRLLAPIPLVDTYLNEWNRIDNRDIEGIFETSHTVAEYVINGLNSRYRNTSIIKESHILEENFKSFLYKDLQTINCAKCGASIDKKHSYCVICGSAALKEKVDFYSNREGRLNSLNYKKINLNEEGIAYQCPICENDDLNPNKEICNICGTYIKNKCSGIYSEDVASYEEVPRPNYLEGCQGTLTGDSRYCSDCGCMSTFYVYDILKHWKDEFNKTDPYHGILPENSPIRKIIENTEKNEIPF